MQVAALYDIHGNLPALEAVLVEVAELAVDRIVVGGDVMPGPMPRKTLEALQQLRIPTEFIAGNGEAEALMMLDDPGATGGVPEHMQESVRWSAEQLTPEQREFLAGWPSSYLKEFPELGTVLFCHATPRNDTEIFTRRTPVERLLPVFEDVKAAIVVCGHTHMQFDRRIGDMRVVNAGSVGMPFGAPGAYWLLVSDRVELRHTSYDLNRAAERIRATGYPMAEHFAQNNVLQPPTEAMALEQFDQAALR